MVAQEGDGAQQVLAGARGDRPVAGQPHRGVRAAGCGRGHLGQQRGIQQGEAEPGTAFAAGVGPVGLSGQEHLAHAVAVLHAPGLHVREGTGLHPEQGDAAQRFDGVVRLETVVEPIQADRPQRIPLGPKVVLILGAGREPYRRVGLGDEFLDLVQVVAFEVWSHGVPAASVAVSLPRSAGRSWLRGHTTRLGAGPGQVAPPGRCGTPACAAARAGEWAPRRGPRATPHRHGRAVLRFVGAPLVARPRRGSATELQCETSTPASVRCEGPPSSQRHEEKNC